jgi:hypothetical protein
MVGAYAFVVGAWRGGTGILPSAARRSARIGAIGRMAVPADRPLRFAFLATVFVAAGIGTAELAGWQVAFTIFSTAAFALDAWRSPRRRSSDGDSVRATSRSSGACSDGRSRGACGSACSSAGRSPRCRASWGSSSRGLPTSPLVQPALLVLAVAQPVCGVVFVLDGVLMGAGDARYLAAAAASTSCRTCPHSRSSPSCIRRGHGLVARGVLLRRLHAGAARTLGWRVRRAPGSAVTSVGPASAPVGRHGRAVGQAPPSGDTTRT